MGGARAGEKYFAPTLVVLLIGMGGDCVTANGWRTDGLKLFRPHIHGALLHWAGATIWDVAMFVGWVKGHH